MFLDMIIVITKVYFQSPKKFTLQIFNQNILLIALGNFFKYSKRINEVPLYNQQKYFGLKRP